MRQAEQMKKRKGWKRRLAAVLTGAVLLAQAALPVYADEGQDSLEKALEAGLAVTVNKPAEDPYAELKAEDVTVDLYRVAGAVPLENSDAYDFEWDALFREQKESWDKTEGEALEQDKLPSAAEIEALTQALAGVVLKDIPAYTSGETAGPGTAALAPAYTGTLETAIPLIRPDGGADPGLYLIIAHGDLNNYKVEGQDGTLSTAQVVKTKLFQFAPMLIAVPFRGAEPAGTGAVTEYKGGWALSTYPIQLGNTVADGGWQNEIGIAAKVGVTDLLGSLRIIKTLTSHEAVDPGENVGKRVDPGENVGKRVDQSTFVFDISVKDGDKVIYSNVVSMIFDGTKTQDEKIITGLPVGAEATVTEVYAGGNYRQNGAPVWTPAAEKHLIVGDDPTTEEKEMLTAAFTNDYDDTWNGGGSVTNSFTTTKKTSAEGEEAPDWDLNNAKDDGKVGQTYAYESAGGTGSER